MKILWLCNIMLPAIANTLGKEPSNIGGWLTGLCNDLSQDKSRELVVTFPNDEKIQGDTGTFRYYGFDKSDRQEQFEGILAKEQPDIIHIFGTEFKHTLEMVNACESLKLLDRVAVNIQGLIYYYGEYHYTAGLPSKVVNGYTFRDFVRQDNIRQQRLRFIERGQDEINAIKKVKYVIGRTDWDKAGTKQINPDVTYFFCNETLRSSFYQYRWDIETCEKHSIFLSQGNYPIKGFHHMLAAMPAILRQYPDAKIYITGKNPLEISGKAKLKEDGYSRYIKQLIINNQLQDHVVFLGSLNEQQMCERYLKSHVFVSASSIENSPNSVGEAMILGVPTVTSDVGGVKNMLTHEEQGYIYQHDAPYMLAYYVCKLFANEVKCQAFSLSASKRAHQTHHQQKNLETVIAIYDAIAKVSS
ncbi:MAG: glycosyltransferase [Eubacteriales bacterium]